MDIKTFKPANQREWSLVGAGALVALLALLLLTSRYSYQPLPGGEFTSPGVMRIDRWTGDMARCTMSCIPLHEGRVANSQAVN